MHPGYKKPWCAGAIVSSQHILTAAHCTDGHNIFNIEVLLGEHDTSDFTVDRHAISAITEHPSFNRELLNYDFSIVTLAAPITFSSSVAAICLPASTSSLYIGQKATVIGWGDTSYEGVSSSILQEVDVTVTTNAQCSNSYGSQIQR